MFSTKGIACFMVIMVVLAASCQARSVHEDLQAADIVGKHDALRRLARADTAPKVDLKMLAAPEWDGDDDDDNDGDDSGDGSGDNDDDEEDDDDDDETEDAETEDAATEDAATEDDDDDSGDDDDTDVQSVAPQSVAPQNIVPQHVAPQKVDLIGKLPAQKVDPTTLTHGHKHKHHHKHAHHKHKHAHHKHKHHDIKAKALGADNKGFGSDSSSSSSSSNANNGIANGNRGGKMKNTGIIALLDGDCNGKGVKDCNTVSGGATVPDRRAVPVPSRPRPNIGGTFRPVLASSGSGSLGNSLFGSRTSVADAPSVAVAPSAVPSVAAAPSRRRRSV